MSDTKVAHARHPDLPSLDRVLQGPPARQPRLLAAIRAVQQEQVHVAQAGQVDGPLDAPAHGIVAGAAARQLGGVVDVLAPQAVGIVRPAEEVQDGLARLALVVVHLRRVKASVACCEGPLGRLVGLLAGHHVQSELDLGDRLAGGQLSWGVSIYPGHAEAENDCFFMASAVADLP